MANPTTNFGWVMPTSTSLVTNLPADFNTFGQGVDTTMAQLKGGTTGQILSKTSATDMAFTWITNDVGDITAVTAGTGISGGGTTGAVTITNSMATAITTAGDLIKGTGSGTFDRLGIGSTGQVLTVSGGAPVWAAAAGGGTTVKVVAAASSTSYTNSTTTWSNTITLSITPTATTSKIACFGMLTTSVTTSSTSFGAVRIANTTQSTNGSFHETSQGTTTGTWEFPQNAIWLDSPASTSAQTYSIQIAKAASGSGDITTSGNPIYLMLMEIGA